MEAVWSNFHKIYLPNAPILSGSFTSIGVSRVWRPFQVSTLGTASLTWCYLPNSGHWVHFLCLFVCRQAESWPRFVFSYLCIHGEVGFLWKKSFSPLYSGYSANLNCRKLSQIRALVMLHFHRGCNSNTMRRGQCFNVAYSKLCYVISVVSSCCGKCSFPCWWCADHVWVLESALCRSQDRFAFPGIRPNDHIYHKLDSHLERNQVKNMFLVTFLRKNEIACQWSQITWKSVGDKQEIWFCLIVTKGINPCLVGPINGEVTFQIMQYNKFLDYACKGQI